MIPLILPSMIRHPPIAPVETPDRRDDYRRA